MLNEINLKFFRQHTNATIDFVDGLNIIKGNNEKGKTTVIEGVGYNWFGSSSLRQPLDMVVTKGSKVGKLFTQTKVTFKEVTYRITRSKKGAEIYKNGGKTPHVTGQKEVTAYMENLFGIPAGKASSLIIAEQGDIRGVLAKGAADTSRFIENLANFSEIDELVGKIASKVSTGSSQPEKDKVTAAEKAFEELEVVNSPDGAHLVLEQDQLNDEKNLLRVEVRTLNKSIADAQSILDTNKTNVASRLQHNATIVKSENSIADLGTEPELSADVVDTEQLLKWHTRADEVSEIVTVALSDLENYKLFKLLPTAKNEWDEPAPTLGVEIKTFSDKLIEFQTGITDLGKVIAVKEASIISGESCQTCGNTPNPIDVEAHNKQVKEELEIGYADKLAFEKSLEEAVDYLEILNDIQATDTSLRLFYNEHPSKTTLGKDVKVPVDINWIGHTLHPTELMDELQSLGEKISKEEELKSSIQAQQMKVDSYAIKSAEHKAKLEVAKESLLAIPVDKPEVDVTEEAIKVTGLEERISAVETELAELDKDFILAQAKFDAYGETNKRLMSEVTSCKHDLESKDLTNLLMKDIRIARNKVTDKIWSSVLTVVSNYFSKMRGEISTVTKGEKTFLVNGGSIGGLSGSTLDILGLSFRIAQSELFLTGLPILCLDEPSSACDDERASTLMGLLKSATDKQTIVITHETVSEGIADKLIEL